MTVAQIIWIGLHLGDKVFADDRGRHSPEWVKINLYRLGLHDRRLTINFANASDVMGDDGAVFYGFNLRSWNVGGDITIAKVF